MFWKVELHKDGSIRKVEPCTEKAENNGHIIYVEAPDKAKACEAALSWWDKAVCKICVKAKATIYPPEAQGWRGLILGHCIGCDPEWRRRKAEHDAEKEAKLDAAQKAHNERWAPMLEREARREREATAAVAKAAATAASKRASLVRRFGKFGGISTAALVRLMNLYDEHGPEAFREWLAAEIATRESGSRARQQQEAAE